MIVRRGIGDISLDPTSGGFFLQLVPLPMWLVLALVGTVIHAMTKQGSR